MRTAGSSNQQKHNAVHTGKGCTIYLPSVPPQLPAATNCAQVLPWSANTSHRPACAQPARRPERMYIFNHPMRCLDFFERQTGFLLFKQVGLGSTLPDMRFVLTLEISFRLQHPHASV